MAVCLRLYVFSKGELSLKFLGVIKNIFKGKTKKSNIDYVCIGGSGFGRAIHAWDDLPKCSCGGYLHMVGKKDDYLEDYEPNRIYCLKCGKTTKWGKVDDIRKEWIDMNLTK